MLPHPLTNFEIQNYYQNKPIFNGVYSRNNLPKRKDGAYVINLDKYKSIGVHWIVLYLNGNDATYFHSFAVKHTPKETNILIGNKNIRNIFKIHSYKSIMCQYFCTGFVDYTLQRKSLLDYTKSFSLNESE